VTSDDDLVTAAKAGDTDAWRELYRAHAGRLLLWLEHRAPRDAAVAAEDIAHEAWVTAASKIAEFRGDTDLFAGWLFGISRHLLANAHRRDARRQTVPSDTLIMPALPGHEDTVVENDWVNEALECLTSRERDVVTLIDVLGLETAAAAKALGLSSTAVRVARHRALKRLRTALAH
jgi:RNA polymerase sigma-70 factor (ECF subfamily)